MYVLKSKLEDEDLSCDGTLLEPNSSSRHSKRAVTPRWSWHQFLAPILNLSASVPPLTPDGQLHDSRWHQRTLSALPYALTESLRHIWYM